MSQVRGDTVVVLSVRFYEERCRETWAGKQPPCASWHAVRFEHRWTAYLYNKCPRNV